MVQPEPTFSAARLDGITPNEKRKSLLWLLMAVLLLLVGGGIVALEQRQSKRDSARPLAQVPGADVSSSNVGCVGRIAPENGTFFVSAHAAGGRVPIISRIRIREGDRVSPGEVIAELDSRAHLESAVRAVQARLNLAQARLTRVKAGANPSEVAAIQAEIARLEIGRDAAQRDYSRNKPLSDKDFISQAQIEALDTRIRESNALIEQARDRLNSVSAVRKEDVDLAEAEVRAAEADLEQAQLEVETSVVRAPSRARVLRVIAHAGEPIGPSGIAELVETDRMMVIAEVYETDIARVHTGQKAVVTSDLLPRPLEGDVAYISLQVQPQQTVFANPGAPSDARVFEVRIKIPDTELLASRINGRVDVVIKP